MSELIIKLLIVAVCLIVGISTFRFFGLKPDNPIEQITEQVIKEETGINVDLSPEKSESINVK